MSRDKIVVESETFVDEEFHPVKRRSLASPQNMILTREMDDIPIGNSFDALVDTSNLEAPLQTIGDQNLRPGRDDIYHSDLDAPDIRGQ